MLEESVLTVRCLYCVCCTSLSEISAHLPALDEFKAAHPQLAASVDQLPGVMFGDRVPATVRKYAGAFDRWSTWAKKHGLASLPANPVGVAVYLLHLGATATSPSPVLAALHGIDWAHRKACLACPGSHPVPHQVAEGLKRTLARPARKMSPLKPHHLEQLVEKFGQPGCELQDLQMVALIALGFRGFFRWNDLSSLCIYDVQIGEEFLSVFLAGRKNDQFREGHVIPIARMESPTCAVKLVERFLREGGHQPDAPLFGKIRKNHEGSCVRSQMMYSRARENLKRMLQAVGADDTQFSLHSLRSGGASAALRTPGIPVRLVQRHGGWRRIESLEGYVEESLESLLCVSRRLG